VSASVYKACSPRSWLLAAIGKTAGYRKRMITATGKATACRLAHVLLLLLQLLVIMHDALHVTCLQVEVAVCLLMLKCSSTLLTQCL
jgi:hypothetical protein